MKFLSLRKYEGNYEKSLKLTDEVFKDLLWWESKLSHEFYPILKEDYTLEIFTDASLTGWGACCLNLKTHGWWNIEEKTHHINFLELKAIFHGLQYFAKNHRSCEILLRADNKTAISYISIKWAVSNFQNYPP